MSYAMATEVPLNQIKLRPMSEAPKDREIFAVFLCKNAYGSGIAGSPDWGNFHPLRWIDCPWEIDNRPHWGMRWCEDFHATLADYGGWFDPRDLHTDIKGA